MSDLEDAEKSMHGEMKWIPLKSGMRSAGMIWTSIFLIAAFPKEASAILRFHSGG
ncbi:MAG: hypothetical protein ISN28_14690 [Ectothiorhodospiraceae bacterium AqS1]|nr:hypothetical protein [Ectothiorhodospiraceae bacterium AqS1]